MNENKKWLTNPDVSCRVEDEEGAILFNPDTDSIQIINQIGLDIWRSIEKNPKILNEIVLYIKDVYPDAPDKKVEKDVEDFLIKLNQKGFIGETVDE